jgi:hypothetical protein
MNRLLMIVLVALLPALFGLQRSPTNDGACDVSSKAICYHVFDSTQSAASTADSDPYEVSSCDFMTYRFDGDGTASLYVKECSALDSNGACAPGDTSVFTPDTDVDGRVTSIDETTVLDGTVGHRGYRMVAPTARWHFIDVQTVPGSGSVHVSIKCIK